tara:strand:+ start:952 stop:1197 length:246 start_codon:yes stop_codon:yes gene_type:complete
VARTYQSRAALFGVSVKSSATAYRANKSEAAQARHIKNVVYRLTNNTQEGLSFFCRLVGNKPNQNKPSRMKPKTTNKNTPD